MYLFNLSFIFENWDATLLRREGSTSLLDNPTQSQPKLSSLALLRAMLRSLCSSYSERGPWAGMAADAGMARLLGGGGLGGGEGGGRLGWRRAGA
jgi:hypothetical protein